MGVRGAAWATVLGQLVSMGLGLLFHLHFNKEISNSFRYWRPSLQAGITVEEITRELEKRHVIDHKVKQERMQ